MTRPFIPLLIGLIACTPASADSLLAARTIRAHAIVTEADVVSDPTRISGAAATPDQVVGLEARVTIYAGRPVLLSEIGPAATIERNQLVALVFREGAITIRAEGRALDRGGPGDLVRAMNASSHTTVTGQVSPEGEILVTP